jgi:hypothetical protein
LYVSTLAGVLLGISVTAISSVQFGNYAEFENTLKNSFAVALFFFTISTFLGLMTLFYGIEKYTVRSKFTLFLFITFFLMVGLMVFTAGIFSVLVSQDIISIIIGGLGLIFFIFVVLMRMKK